MKKYRNLIAAVAASVLACAAAAPPAGADIINGVTAEELREWTAGTEAAYPGGSPDETCVMVKTDDASVIGDAADVVGEYEGLYLAAYATESEAEQAVRELNAQGIDADLNITISIAGDYADSFAEAVPEDVYADVPEYTPETTPEAFAGEAWDGEADGDAGETVSGELYELPDEGAYTETYETFETPEGQAWGEPYAAEGEDVSETADGEAYGELREIPGEGTSAYVAAEEQAYAELYGEPYTGTDARENGSGEALLEIAGSPEYTASEEAGENALNAAADLPDRPVRAQGGKRVIALLDTGAPADAHVVGRVSVLPSDASPDDLHDRKHGTKMLAGITEQDPDACVLSVRVLNEYGNADVASVAAGIRYAMEQGADIINLSMASPKRINTLNALVEEAVLSGIIVVGAAGNDGTDASGYFPGGIDAPFIVGACDECGVRCGSSNYGPTVDWNVFAKGSSPGLDSVAYSTSLATAMTSGYLSAKAATAGTAKNLLDSVTDCGLFFERDFTPVPIAEAIPLFTEPAVHGEAPGVGFTWRRNAAVRALAEGADYTLTVTGSKADGAYVAHVTGLKSFSGDAAFRWEIPRKDIQSCTVGGFEKEKTYTGFPRLQQSVTVSALGRDLRENEDYIISYKNSVGPGAAEMTISGTGIWGGQAVFSYRITDPRTPVSQCTVNGVRGAYYTGIPVTQDVTVLCGSRVLEEGKDYLVSYENNMAPGTARVIVTGAGNYSGSTSREFVIYSPPDTGIGLDACTVRMPGTFTYDGKAKKPAPQVLYQGTLLRAGADYTAEYIRNTDAGTALVRLKGKDRFCGTRDVSFRIERRTLADASVGNVKNRTYTGYAVTQDVSVTCGGRKLVKGRDYTLAYKNNKNAGTASVTVKGAGNYSGSKTVTFNIAKADISAAKIYGLGKTYNYTGKKIAPKISVRGKDGKTVPLTEYTVTYGMNREMRGTVRVSGRNNHKGQLQASFTIYCPVKKINISRRSASLKKGKTLVLKAECLPVFANNRTVTWKSSAPKTASVNGKGVVKGLKKGTAVITAVSKNGVTVKCTVKVY